mmetsp:Transcript_2488/g.4244  ORF Transcript_2488/g.4244 Transcript_2488/m.4244 type:complete len:282 (-) Transcript_2488:147-992(-)
MTCIESDTMPLLEFPCEETVKGVGRELHCHISPEKWCMTILDLDDFGERVRELHHAHVFPDGDGMDGPSMRSVCEHLVVPETWKAGGMSWALMLHPEGAPPGAFVCHSFDEGAYDFHRKIRESMPGGQATFWSRFFALPHCWGSAEVLRLFGNDPTLESPFFSAISHADIFLAVPNKLESIFCRSWCVLEVCIAFEKQMSITPATGTTQCTRRTSIGSASHAAARISNSLPQAVTELFKDFTSASEATDTDPYVETYIRQAVKGKENWLDGSVRSAFLGFL